MVFTTDEKQMIKILVEKELESFNSDAKNLMITNADYITKSSQSPSDLEFLKTELKYQKMLENLKSKLTN